MATPQSGRTRRKSWADRRADQRATFEHFCCQQVARVEAILSGRYAVDGDNEHEFFDYDQRRLAYVLPQNSYYTRWRLMGDAIIESRGIGGAVGRRRRAHK